MKRTLSLVLALIFAVGICFSAPVTINANAVEEQEVQYLIETDGFKGDEITFKVLLAPNQSVQSSLVSVKFDTAALSVVSGGAAMVTDEDGNETEAVPGLHEQGISNGSASVYTFAYVSSNGYKIGSNPKEFKYVTFKLKDSACKATTIEFLNGTYSSENVIKTYSEFSTLPSPNVTAIESKSMGLSFSWDSVEGAEGYVIYKKTGTEISKLAVLSNATTSFTDTDTSNKQTYTYGIASMDSEGRESLYGFFDATYDFSLATPGFEITNEKNGIKLVWGNVKDAEGYIIYRSTKASGGAWSLFADIARPGADASEYLDETAVSGTEYRYAVSAVAGAFESDYTESRPITFLSAPNITATESSARGITLTWDNVSGAKGYTVFKKTVNGFEKIGTTLSGVLTYTDKNVLSDITYTYVVAATDASGNVGPYSEEKQVYFEFVLQSPAAQIERAKGGIKVTWEIFPGVTGYKVYRAVLNADNTWSQFVQIAKVGGSVTTYLDKNVTSNGVYAYAVASLSDIGESEVFINNSILYIGEPVVNEAKSTEQGATFSWSQVTGATGYVIYKKVGSEMFKLTDVDASTFSFTDSGVKSGEEYTYAVAALDRFGQPGSYTEFILNYVKPQVNLATPVVKAVPTAKGMKITWNKITNAEKYTVYQRSYNASTKKWSGWKALKTTTGLSFVDTTTKIGTNYRYTVKAIKGSSTSKITSTGTVKYDVKPTVKVANASNGVKVTWSTVANATGYTIYSSTYNAKTKKWSSWKNRGTAAKNKTAWVDKSAKGGTYYRYTVRAKCGSALSSFTASQNVLRLLNPKVKAVKASNGVKVTWNKVAGAKNYKIYRAEYANGKWSAWSAIKTTNNKTVAYTDKTAKKGVYYRYTVRAVNGNSASAYTASGNVKR